MTTQNNESDKENSNEHLAQIALFFDEMQASLLGADSGANKKEGAKRREDGQVSDVQRDVLRANPELS